MIQYLTIPQAAVKWKVSSSDVRRCCESHTIKGVLYISRRWLIPENADVPEPLQLLGAFPYKYNA